MTGNAFFTSHIMGYTNFLSGETIRIFVNLDMELLEYWFDDAGKNVQPVYEQPSLITEFLKAGDDFSSGFTSHTRNMVSQRLLGIETIYKKCDRGVSRTFHLERGDGISRDLWVDSCIIGAGIVAMPDFVVALFSRGSNVVEGMASGNPAHAGAAVSEGALIAFDLWSLRGLVGGAPSSSMPQPAMAIANGGSVPTAVAGMVASGAALTNAPAAAGAILMAAEHGALLKVRVTAQNGGAPYELGFEVTSDLAGWFGDLMGRAKATADRIAGGIFGALNARRPVRQLPTKLPNDAFAQTFLDSQVVIDGRSFTPSQILEAVKSGGGSIYKAADKLGLRSVSGIYVWLRKVRSDPGLASIVRPLWGGNPKYFGKKGGIVLEGSPPPLDVPPNLAAVIDTPMVISHITLTPRQIVEALRRNNGFVQAAKGELGLSHATQLYSWFTRTRFQQPDLWRFVDRYRKKQSATALKDR
jgi:transposase-like protein